MKNWFRGFGIKYPTHLPNPQPHPALQHLQITIQPDEYMEIVHILKKFEPPKQYIEKLPVYVISRCPFCNTEYKSRLDTYSLLSGWYGGAPSSGNAFGGLWDGRCAHFLAIHPFMNLNGLFPEEKSQYFRNDYDVPFISPLFLPEEVPSYAVMHSLPICRLEEGQFVPRYYLYTLTYYVPEDYVSWVTIQGYPEKIRRGIITERRAREIKANNFHWEEFLYHPLTAREHPEWWDLPLWVKREKLLWLDPYSPNLELKNGPIEDFPYANIQGYRRAIEIKNGKFSFRD